MTDGNPKGREAIFVTYFGVYNVCYVLITYVIICTPVLWPLFMCRVPSCLFTNVFSFFLRST